MQLWVQRLAGKKWPLDVPDGVEVLHCCACTHVQARAIIAHCGPLITASVSCIVSGLRLPCSALHR